MSILGQGVWSGEHGMVTFKSHKRLCWGRAGALESLSRALLSSFVYTVWAVYGLVTALLHHRGATKHSRLGRLDLILPRHVCL